MWMNVETAIQSEVGQKQKTKYRILTNVFFSFILCSEIMHPFVTGMEFWESGEDFFTLVKKKGTHKKV